MGLFKMQSISNVANIEVCIVCVQVQEQKIHQSHLLVWLATLVLPMQLYCTLHISLQLILMVLCAQIVLLSALWRCGHHLRCCA